MRKSIPQASFELLEIIHSLVAAQELLWIASRKPLEILVLVPLTLYNYDNTACLLCRQASLPFVITLLVGVLLSFGSRRARRPPTGARNG